MDFKQIQELIKIVNKSNIGEITIEENDFRIKIKQKKEKGDTYITTPAVSQPQVSNLPASPAPAPAPQASPSQPAAPTTGGGSEKQAENLVTIKSPMIGTFYRKASPDKPTFVEVGDDITPGKVICIIEAMKLFNEIESEVSGKIVKVLVDDASPVEFDQPLFLVEP